MNKQHKYHKSIVPGNSFSTKVINKDINFALRSWKKQLKTSNTLDILKEKQEFEKPSVTKRKIKNSAIFNQYIQDLKSL
jgi:ribosomal protein S21